MPPLSATHPPFYAHTSSDPRIEWEPLHQHLDRVANTAATFAEAFDSESWGHLAGLWHDLGKYSEKFQAYLRSSNAAERDAHTLEIAGRVDHSTAGAQHANQTCGPTGRLLAYALAGHHAGLPDAVDKVGGGKSGLDTRLNKPIEPWQCEASHAMQAAACPQLPSFDFHQDRERALSFQVAFFGRMVFSSLVDADFLETEKYMNPTQAEQRTGNPPSMSELSDALETHLATLQSQASDSPVNRKRREVLEACRNKASLEPGLFSLTVPTGGGKTLSSLAFALDHAKTHNLRRVIYAAPFTSIIEQNADECRRALGQHSQWVLEHHSNLDQDDEEKQTAQSRLASENWDAPLIVTTNVQLLESLFAAKTLRCRKLHRIAGSVILLDEVQTLPVELLRPTLAALDELARNYGCSIVLSTATQPAIEWRESFPIGLTGVRPIVEDPKPLFESLKRVEVETGDELNDEQLVERLAGERQALCIVNTRDHAKQLFTTLVDCDSIEGIEASDCFHLSAQMCPAHRGDVLGRIRAKLNGDEPCRVISTQLVEAGVDIDFPVVYRAMTGLDSLAQAAGRCNREGRLESGRVVLFEVDRQEHRPPSFVTQAADDLRQVMPDHAEDLLAPAANEAYFRQHYWKKGGEGGEGWDKPGVMGCFAKMGTHLQYGEAARKYQLIDQAQQPVIVPYGDHGDELVRQFLAMPEPPGQAFNRKLQRYVVGLYPQQLARVHDNAVLMEPHDDGRFVLSNPKAYDNALGLRLDVYGMNLPPI